MKGFSLIWILIIGVILFSGLFLIVLSTFLVAHQTGDPNTGTGGGPVDTSLSGRVPAPLAEVFQEMGQKTGVPPALLAAFSTRECGRIWQVPEATLRDWINNNKDVDSRGCNFNNGSWVWGPAQFLDKTWGVNLRHLPKGAAYPVPHPVPSNAYGEKAGNLTGHKPASMVNIKDVYAGMALKLKYDSGNKGGAWTEEEIRKAAKAYCGSCTDVRACGGDYCDAIVRLYNKYRSEGSGLTKIRRKTTKFVFAPVFAADDLIQKKFFPKKDCLAVRKDLVARLKWEVRW